MIEEAARFGLAWYLGASSEISRRIRGAELIPGDADAWRHLGQSLRGDFDEDDPAKELPYFLRATELDPRSANNWMDLAAAYDESKDEAAAQEAFDEARKDYPTSAKVAWNYGNFLLRQGKTAEALEQIHQAVLADPNMVLPAIGEVWRFDPDVNLILRGVLPEKAEAYWQALDFFSSVHNTQAGLATWQRIASHSDWFPLDLKQVFPLMDELIAEGRNEDAEGAWRSALAASRWTDEAPRGNSAIWNGGFESEIADGGLDWRVVQTPGAIVSMDAVVFHAGTRSVRVSFSEGMNLDYAGVHELTLVRPGTTYEFQAYLRTEGITTESGMCFEVIDPLHPQETRLVTPALTGTNSWTEVRVTVKTTPETHYLDVRLRRFPSRLFDNKLGGTVWVDDVTLIPSGSESEKSSP